MIKNKLECIFSYIDIFYVETVTKRKQIDSSFKAYDFNEIVCWQRIWPTLTAEKLTEIYSKLLF